MAYLEVTFHEDRFEIISQVFCCEIHDTWENRKVWFVILRSLCSPKTGKPFFSYQRIADEFGYKARQNINNYVREYTQCDEDMFDYLRHKRKVDPVVVEAVRTELGNDVLVKTGELCIRVNHRLEREDLTSSNIRVALEQIPCSVIRTKVLREITQGRFHPKEDVVLAELFAAVEQGYIGVNKPAVGSCCSPVPALSADDSALVKGGDGAEIVAERSDVEELISAVSLESNAGTGKLLRYAEVVFAAGVKSIREEPDEAVTHTTWKVIGICLFSYPPLTPSRRGIIAPDREADSPPGGGVRGGLKSPISRDISNNLPSRVNMVNDGAIQSAFLFPQTDPDVTVTMPLFYSAAVFVYKKSRFPNGVSYNALSELKDYKIGALTGSQWSIKLLQEEAGLTLDFAPANDMNMKKLESERIDLLPLFHITALSLMESVFPGRQDEFGVTAPFSITPLCLIFSTTYPGNTAIIDDVTGKLAEIDRQALLQKHFGKYFPQGIVPPHTVTGEISE